MAATLEMNPAIIGIGMALPEQVMDNDALAARLAEHGQETNDSIIREKTGIESRHWVGDDEDVYSLGAEAGRRALCMALIDPQDLGDIYVATSSPTGPNAASFIHGELGANESYGSLDINAACAGGVVAMQLAARGMKTEGQMTALAIGVDILSSKVNLQDRRSAILFGDAAGGGVFGWRPGAVEPAAVRMTRVDRKATYRDSETGKIVMNGKRVAEHAGFIIPEMARRAAQKAGIADPDDPEARIDWSKVDYFVPHQANKRLIEKAGEALEVPEHKLITASVEVHGNTSAASVFLGIAEAYRRGQIEPGLRNVLFSAIGSGMNGAGFYASLWLPERTTGPKADAVMSLAA